MNELNTPTIPELPREDQPSEQQVWSVIEFARSLYSGVYPGVLTPDLVSSRMKDINLNPMAPTQKILDEALADPKNSESALQGVSESFEIQSQPYRRLLSYLGNMLAFDVTRTCINANEEDYTTSKYKKDLDIVNRFLDSFDYKKEFNTVVKEMLRNEAYFGCPRFIGNHMILQELPTSPVYTKITGRWEYGTLFSFYMYWFMLPGIDLDMYPSFFKVKMNEIFGQTGKMPKYIPSLPPEARGESSWVYWVDIPPSVGWAFKLTPEIATRVPYFSPLFNDLILQGLMRNLQKNVNMSVAVRMIMGQVPMLKEAKANVKDMIAMSPDVLGKFLSLLRSAISDSIKVSSAPLDNIQAFTFPAENELYNSFLETALATSGVNTNLIFTGKVRPNIMETQLSLNTDEQLMESVYPQFNAFMNYQVNSLTKYYKFNFHFEGTNFFNNRQQRFDKQMLLMDKGIVLPQKLAAALGMSPQNFQRQLEESQTQGWVDKLTPIVSGFQMSGKDGGRPQKSDSELGDAGESTRATSGNQE